ncbi:hypothetical protein GCM10027259_13630 [Micromonospora palomenae]
MVERPTVRRRVVPPASRLIEEPPPGRFLLPGLDALSDARQRPRRREPPAGDPSQKSDSHRHVRLLPVGERRSPADVPCPRPGAVRTRVAPQTSSIQTVTVR